MTCTSLSFDITCGLWKVQKYYPGILNTKNSAIYTLPHHIILCTLINENSSINNAQHTERPLGSLKLHASSTSLTCLQPRAMVPLVRRLRSINSGSHTWWPWQVSWKPLHCQECNWEASSTKANNSLKSMSFSLPNYWGKSWKMF